MRPSPLRHPLAVLRNLVGLSQKQLADFVAKSTSTIQAIELGKLKLSDELAIKISVETGVSAQWLIDGDPQAQPIPNDLNPIPPSHPSGVFSKEYFERRRADRMEGRDELNRLSGGANPFDSARLFAINAAAAESGNGRLARYRISKFLRELEKEFGQSKETFKREMNTWGQLDEFICLFMYPDRTPDEAKGGQERIAHGEPAWANYREFVPAFKRAYAKLEKESKRRRKKDNPEEPDIFPLLKWTVETIKVISPKLAAQVIPPKEEMAASKARRRASKSSA
jgi:transcriptional regulator with XRE-family HTH domain